MEKGYRVIGNTRPDKYEARHRIWTPPRTGSSLPPFLRRLRPWLGNSLIFLYHIGRGVEFIIAVFLAMGLIALAAIGMVQAVDHFNK